MQVFLVWYYTNTTFLYTQIDWITEHLEHVLEKEYLWKLRGDNDGRRNEITSGLREIV